MHKDSETTAAVWLSTLQNRVLKQVEKYARERKMLIPVRFTGSLEDLRSIVLRTTLPGQQTSTRLLSTSLTSFNDDELNEWCRQFQEYWLNLLAAFMELKRRTVGPTNTHTNTATKNEPERLNFLTNTDNPFLRVAVETMLAVFENDRLPSPSYTVRSEKEIVTEIVSRLSPGNRYLARRILERPDLTLKR